MQIDIARSTLCVMCLAFCGKVSVSTPCMGNAWTTHGSGRLADPVAGARTASSGIERNWAWDHCLVHTPYRPGEPGTGRQEDDPRQVRNQWAEVMVDHRCFGRPVLEAAGRHLVHLEDQRAQRVLARRPPSGRHPPPSFVLSILCGFL